MIFFGERDPRAIQRTAYFEWKMQSLVKLKCKTESAVSLVLSSMES